MPQSSASLACGGAGSGGRAVRDGGRARTRAGARPRGTRERQRSLAVDTRAARRRGPRSCVARSPRRTTRIGTLSAPPLRRGRRGPDRGAASAPARSTPCSRASTASSAQRAGTGELAADRPPRAPGAHRRTARRRRASAGRRSRRLGRADAAATRLVAATSRSARRSSRCAAEQGLTQLAACSRLRARRPSARARRIARHRALAHAGRAPAAAADGRACASRDADARRRCRRVPPARADGERPARRGRAWSPSIPTVIPLGTRLFVPGYGPAVAADVGVGDQGQHHRPLDAEHGRRARLGAPDRHDHHLRLAPVRLRIRRRSRSWRRALRSRRRRRPPREHATCGRASRTRFARRPSRSAARPRSPSTRAPATCSTPTTHRRRSCPASNEKLPVSWAALTRLGPGFRFRTEVLGAGAREGATWRGDLFLKGYGDPTLPRPTSARLAAAVRGAGITRRHGVDPRRRVASTTAGATRRDGSRRSSGIETPPLSALVVDRARGWGASKPPPLLAARRLRAALVARGVRVAGPAGLGTAPDAVDTLARDRSAALSADRPRDEPRQRQLHRRDGPQAARDARRRARLDRRRRRGS